MPAAAVNAVTDENISQAATHYISDPAAQASTGGTDIGYRHLGSLSAGGVLLPDTMVGQT